MLQSADGERVGGGDSFVVHMDREALGDLPMGRYDGQYEIADRYRQAAIFPIIPDVALKATLGILAGNVE